MPGKCHECGSREPIEGLKLCAACRSRKIIRREHRQTHNASFLELMLRACYDPASCCSSTGRSLLALRKVGERLSVDRINPNRGYVPGNVQLLAMSLNAEKNSQRQVPRRALDALLRKLEHVTEDILSSPEGAAQRF